MSVLKKSKKSCKFGFVSSDLPLELNCVYWGGSSYNNFFYYMEFELREIYS